MKPTTHEWLTFARKDLMNCERILSDPFLTNIVAFHAQQTIEKCFKALIEEYELGFIRTHDLLRLSALVGPYLTFELDDELLGIVNEVYIDARYPGEFGLLRHGNPSQEDAARFYQFARQIFDQIGTLLAQHVEEPPPTSGVATADEPIG